MSLNPLILCGYRNPDSIATVCNTPAVRYRRSPGDAWISFFCAEHSLPSDPPIDDGTPIRLVTLLCAVTLCGTTTARELAEAEARGRLQLACLSAGGSVTIEHVSSTTGRHRAPRPASKRYRPRVED